MYRSSLEDGDVASEGANTAGHAVQQTDEAYAQRARLGDSAAFAALAVRYWSAVHRMARCMLPDASEADEATEETFLLALRSAEFFPPDVPFRTSVYRVAMDRSLTRLRAFPRAAAGSAAEFLPRFDATGRLATDEMDGSGLGEELIKRRDLAARIREGFGCLDDLDRASFILRDVEQLPTEDAAAILRTSPEEIRGRAHRARLMMIGFLGRLVSAPARETIPGRTSAASPRPRGNRRRSNIR